jgi:hypothetical protein
VLTQKVPANHPSDCQLAGLCLQTFDNKSVFRAVLFSELDFESTPWDVLSGGRVGGRVGLQLRAGLFGVGGG